MKPVKQTKKYKAIAGHVLPIYYQGSIIRIVESEETPIDIDALEYEPRIQFDKALAKKIIIETGDK